MDKYTASNGYTVADGAATIRNRAGDVRHRLGKYSIDALREFFRAERDEELRRWRWPENPDYVVYHAKNVNGDRRVVRESDGSGVLWGRDMEPAPNGTDGSESAAHAYFDAHPVRKPWEDAKPGELWDVDVERGGLRAVTVYSARHDEPITVFRDPYTQIEYETDDPTIRDARRIFPEPD